MDQTAQTMPGAGAMKQAGNGSETVGTRSEVQSLSSNELREAATALREIIENDWETQRLAKKLLLARCALVQESPERSNEGWTPDDIARAIRCFGVKGWEQMRRRRESGPTTTGRTCRRYGTPEAKGLSSDYRRAVFGPGRRFTRTRAEEDRTERGTFCDSRPLRATRSRDTQGLKVQFSMSPRFSTSSRR